MKKILIFLFSIIIYVPTIAQDHLFIKEHLRIIFISDMRLPPGTQGNEVLLNNDPNHPFWTNPVHAEAVKFIRRLTEPLQQAGRNVPNAPTRIPTRRTRLLQQVVRAILQISNKPVELYIFSDNVFTEENHKNWKYYSKCGGWLNKRFAAPCGQYRDNKPLISGTLGVGTGYFSERKSDMFCDEAFIYELAMTQLGFGFEPNFPRNMELEVVNVRGDVELLSSKNYATKRGIAMAFSLFYHYQCMAPVMPEQVQIEAPFYESKKVLNWYNKRLPLKLSVPLICQNAQKPGQFCLTELLRQDGLTVNPGQRVYPLPCQQLSARVLLHNEMVQANIFSSFLAMHSVAPLSMFTNCIKEALIDLQNEGRNSPDMFRLLFKQMVIQSGQAISNGQYLPIAILDYYTGLKINGKRELALAIGSYLSWTQAAQINLDVYFQLYSTPLRELHIESGLELKKSLFENFCKVKFQGALK